MDTIIVETDEDGNEFEVDIEVCNEIAHQVLDDIFEKEGKLPMYSAIPTLYHLHYSILGVLLECGWTKEDLIKDIEDKIQETHEDNQTNPHLH